MSAAMNRRIRQTLCHPIRCVVTVRAPPQRGSSTPAQGNALGLGSDTNDGGPTPRSRHVTATRRCVWAAVRLGGGTFGRRYVWAAVRQRGGACGRAGRCRRG